MNKLLNYFQMINIFRYIEQPTLNIESIGCYNPYADLQKEIREPKKVYVASLNYKIKSLFGTSNKAVYIPIMFENEDEIKLIFSHYDNLYFRIIEHTYFDKKCFKEYHISKLINIDKIYKKTLSSFNYKYKLEIQFFIKYHNYNIELYNRDHYYNRFKGFTINNFDINSLYEDSENHIINLFQKEKNNVPIFDIYYLNYPIKTGESLSEILQYIDTLLEYKQKEKELVDSYYSKKSYKLVEEK